MGTTLTALQANAGVAVEYVVAIEGYGVLLCSNAPAAVLTAWAGTDWTEAVGGLSVSGKMGQTLDPWRPFGESSTLTLSVVACPGQIAGSDRFGRDVWNRTGGVASDLKTSVDCDDTSIVVNRADDFTANGAIYVENEAMTYTSRSAATDTFTGLTRGAWSPFTRESGARFAHPHRLSDTTITGVRHPPEVTSLPRAMTGRWVGVWIHRRTGTTLDTKSEAHLAWAGRVQDIEETESGATVLTCEDLRAFINDTVILRDQYTARVKEGIFLPRNTKFTANTSRFAASNATLELTSFTVVTSGAVAPNQLNEGTYTVEAIASHLNRWFAAEKTASRSLFNVTYVGYVPTPDGMRPRLTYSDPTSGTAFRAVKLMCNDSRIATAMGWGADELWARNTAQTESGFGVKAPMRLMLMQIRGFAEFKFDVENARGTWINQSTTLPGNLIGNGNQGILRLGDLGYIAAYQNSPTQFQYAPVGSEFSPGPGLGDVSAIGFTVEEEGDLDIAQVLILEETWVTVMRRMLSSTGTTSFNNTYDVLPEQAGCGIPHSLIDALVDTDLTTADHAALLTRIVVDKPTKFAELCAADFIVRKCFLIWRSGEMHLTSWQTPVEEYASVALTENNKASPADNRDMMRASVMESTEWMRNVVKIRYGRRTDGTYAYTTNLEDAPSVRRYGARPVEISLRNLSTSTVALVLDQFVATFAEWMPILSRPQVRVRRTIARTLFETACAGSQATIADDHVRDWTTGIRGLATEPALVVSHWYDWGCGEHGEGGAPRVRAPMGECEVLIYPSNVAQYVPCAQVDDTQANAGYNAGTGAITVYANKHSESTEAVDSSRFAAGYAIRIVEIDPATAASPLTWDRIVSTVVGNVITPTVTLSAPAWDATKRYRVIFDTYGDCTATQKTKCFQADDADGLIEDVATPFEYAVGQPLTVTTLAVATELPARHATLAYGDGRALDVGYEYDIATLANNIVGYKSAVQSPRIFSEERSREISSGWLIADCSYIYVGAGMLGSDITRKLYVSPRLLTSAVSGSVRISLLAAPPAGSSLTDAAFPTPAIQVTFTTTSATYEVQSAQALDIRHLSLVHGFGFLVVELGSDTMYSGLSVEYVGPLVTP